jgi:hypothetical protein
MAFPELFAAAFERRRTRIMSRPTTAALSLGLAIALSIGMAAGAAAQSQRAGIVTVATGTVQVARTPAPGQPLKFRDDVFVHDRVSTGEHSLARILLGGKAVVTLSERSVVTITEIPGHSIIDLATGRLSLAVARDRMKPGDSVDIRTSVAVAGVRGTVVIAEVSPAANPVDTATRFTVLKGLVEVSALDPTTRQAFGASTFLAARQTLLADRRGVTSPTAISQQAAERLSMLFEPPLATPTGPRAAITESHLAKAADDLRDVARATPGGKDVDRRGREDGRANRKAKDVDDMDKSAPMTADAVMIDVPQADTSKAKGDSKFDGFEMPRADKVNSRSNGKGKNR